MRADNAYDALRQTVGLNPVTVTKTKNTYYVEALQHGKYLYSGKATGTDGEPAVAVTVMLLAPKDSTVLTYGITDEGGRFSIPCDRQGVIAKLSCVGFKTTYKRLDSFNAGTIIMPRQVIALGPVTVKADNSRLYSDKSVYLPSARQKNAAQTGIDLLRYLAIPQITVNLVDESVTTLAGSPVAVYINGLPASSEELSGMRTADVKTVEYIDFPTDPRFNGNEHVINFIMLKYEYGGYTKFSVNENLLTGLSSRAAFYSKFTYKRMMYDLYAGTSNLDLHNTGPSKVGRYTLTDTDGKEKCLIRSEDSGKSHLRNNQYPVTLRAVYDSDKVQIGNTIGFNFDQSPLDETHGVLSYTPGNGSDYSYKTNQPNTTRHFVWTGAYYFIFPNDFQLSLSPRANYGHTNYSYFYTTSESRAEAINNDSQENYYQISGGASLYKGFSQSHSGFANIYAGTNRNDVSYTGTSPFDNEFSDSFAGVRLGYNYNDRKWKFSSDAAIQYERNGINGEHVSEVYPLINISGRYTPTAHHSLQAFFHYGANYHQILECSCQNKIFLP